MAWRPGPPYFIVRRRRIFLQAAPGPFPPARDLSLDDMRALIYLSACLYVCMYVPSVCRAHMEGEHRAHREGEDAVAWCPGGVVPVHPSHVPHRQGPAPAPEQCVEGFRVEGP